MVDPSYVEPLFTPLQITAAPSGNNRKGRRARKIVLQSATSYSHCSGELDRIICLTFDNDKISNARRTELMEVYNKLHFAISQSLTEGFMLEVFGSSENGFGTNQSDFDICFRFAHGNGFEKTPRMHFTTIQSIEFALRNAGFSRVMSITSAKVPIVKFADQVRGGEILGDISYYNELALHNTRLLKRYCSWTKDNLLSKLGIFIKRWAKHCDIGDASKGSLSSYTWNILLIHFLQRVKPHPLLPILQKVGVRYRIKVERWDVYFCDDEPKPDWSKCKLSVGQLFLKFLEYFAAFNWEKQVVQIRQSNKLSKGKKKWKKMMCIEHPFELNHNLGSGISDRMFYFIISAFNTSRVVFSGEEERANFMNEMGDVCGMNLNFALPIPDFLFPRYRDALLAKCKSSIGEAPRGGMCEKCGRIGHFTQFCQDVKMVESNWSSENPDLKFDLAD